MSRWRSLNVTNNYVTISIGQRMVNELRARMFDHLQRLSLSFHRRREVGDLMVRIAYDTFSMQTIAMNGIFPIVVVGRDSAGRDVRRDDPHGRDADARGAGDDSAADYFDRVDQRANRRLASGARVKESRLYTVAHQALAAIHVVQAFTREAESYREFVAIEQREPGRDPQAYTRSKRFTPARSTC